MSSLDLRVWLLGTVAAAVGWLLAILVVVIGLRPGGWAFPAAAILALALVTLFARKNSLGSFEAFGVAFVCMVLEWPLFHVLTLVVLSDVGVYHPD